MSLPVLRVREHGRAAVRHGKHAGRPAGDSSGFDVREK